MNLHRYPNTISATIYSQNKSNQLKPQQKYAGRDFPQLRLFAGVIINQKNLRLALDKVGIASAGLKQVPAAKNNPIELAKRNKLSAKYSAENDWNRAELMRKSTAEEIR